MVRALPHRALAAATLSAAASLALAPSVAAAAVDGVAGAQIARLVFGLVVVIAALLLVARFLPRIGGAGSGAGESLRIVAALTVGQRERIVVLQVGSEQMMLGVAPGRVNLLHRLEQPITRQQLADDSSVQGWLYRTLKGKRS